MGPRSIRLAGAAVVACALVAARFTRVAVEGTSMMPALLPGDRLLVRRTRRVSAGDLVVVRDPRDGRLLAKRAAAVRADRAVEVRGDRPDASTDSRHFGPVPRRLVVGRAVFRYLPAGRAGRLAAAPNLLHRGRWSSLPPRPVHSRPTAG